MNYSTMSLEELKRSKNGWQIWLRIFEKRRKETLALERDSATQWEILALATAYGFCIHKTQQAIDIYSYLINKAEFNDLSEKEFKSKIFEAKKINREIQNELSRPKNRELADKYFGASTNESGFNF